MRNLLNRTRFSSVIKSVFVRSEAKSSIHSCQKPFTFSKLRYYLHSARMQSTERQLDETQIELLKEECILVDEADKNVGSASKKKCHLLENINNGMLHRAFSVFLFNKQGELLIQQRSDAKITFPGHWTNTCCSHPLSFLKEIEEKEAVGVRRAAQRKLKHELGIEPEQVPVDGFHYLTRIHYQSDNVPADNTWGEHEIDYILFTQRDVNIEPNQNEVKDYKFLSKEKLTEFIGRKCILVPQGRLIFNRFETSTEKADENGILLTPWFRLIAKTFLFRWWGDLDSLQQHEDHAVIHRML